MASGRALWVGGLALALGLAVASPASSAVKLSVSAGDPETVPGAVQGGSLYASGTTVWIECPGKGTPLAAGWRDVGAPVAMVYSNNLVSNRIIGIEVRRPSRPATVRSLAVCVRGAGSAITRESASGEVSCPAGRLAVGVPIDGGPYWSQAVASMPVGLRGWRNTEGGYARAKVVCVPSRAFRSAHVVTKEVTFPAGQTSASVEATCRAGTRPLGWGFQAGTMEGNRFTSSVSSATMSVPFVSASAPSGSRGWSLRFATPDGAPAAAEAPIAIAVTCAAPR